MTETLVEKKSTHKAEVVPVVLEKHPDADSLSIVRVYGYTCCCRTSDWVGIDKGVYIVPDSVVSVTRPEFAFLAEQAKADGKARIKAKRLRGVVSYGLLIPAPEGAQLGEDWAEKLGVERYEPPEPGQSQKDKFVIGGEEEAGPDFPTGPSYYDIDDLKLNGHRVFVEGEPVVVLEKCDGSNVRYLYWNDRFWVKSRNRWVKRIPDYSHITRASLVEKGISEEDAQKIVDRIALKRLKINGFWEILERHPELMEYLKTNPGTTVYGEVFGNTNRIKYGFQQGNVFAAFDVFESGRFLDIMEARRRMHAANVPFVPVLADALPYSLDAIQPLVEGTTVVAGAKEKTIREGVVVRPLVERWDPRLGRVILKCHSPDFLAL